MKTIKLFAVTLLCATTLAAASVTMATQKKGNSGVASCCNMKHCCYGNKKCCKKADHACCTGAHAKGTCCCKKGSCPMPAKTARS